MFYECQQKGTGDFALHNLTKKVWILTRSRATGQTLNRASWREHFTSSFTAICQSWSWCRGRRIWSRCPQLRYLPLDILSQPTHTAHQWHTSTATTRLTSLQDQQLLKTKLLKYCTNNVSCCLPDLRQHGIFMHFTALINIIRSRPHHI
jgi:hypothetical protein